MIKIRVIVFLFIVLVQGISFADTLYLNNGSVIKGVIETQTDSAISIVISIGIVTYSKAEIKTVSKSNDEENAKLKEEWKTQKQQRESEQEQQRKLAEEQEAAKEKPEQRKPEERKPPEEKPKEEASFKLIDTITFRDETDKQTYRYAVRLPPKYNEKTKWPVLFCFDPVGNGGDAARRNSYAAEKLGWIVVGSLDAKNGPWEPIVSAQEAMLKDIPKRFSVDKKRFYATGFSGGARMSFNIAYSHPAQFKGVIACSAGFGEEKREIAKNVAVYLCVGKSDSNLSEMQQVYNRLNMAHVKVYKHEFGGGHDWPSSEIISQALDWIAKQ